jgi:sulfatase modifying factor 1
MFFPDCENLVNDDPTIREELLRIDLRLRSMNRDSVIVPAHFSDFVQIPVDRLSELLDLLKRRGLLKREEIIRCPGCDTMIPDKDVRRAWDQSVVLFCSQCNSTVETISRPRERVFVFSEKAQALLKLRHTSGTPMTESRPEIHLLLSGGGYRATLFHLGVLRYLYEHSDSLLGHSLLSRVTRVIGVSGGSITAAHFAANRARYLANFADAAKPLLTFATEVDLRRAVLHGKKSPADVLLPLFGNVAIGSLSSSQSLKLEILGTSLHRGHCISFATDGIKIFANEPVSHDGLCLVEEIKGEALPVRYAVAASTAFPPFFSPLLITPKLFGPSHPVGSLGQLSGQEVADGGIRDNLGIEYYLATNTHAPSSGESLSIISDAGLDFDWSNDCLTTQSLSNWGLRLLRAIDIQMMRLWHSDLSKAIHCIHVSFAGVQKMPLSENENLKPFAQPLTRTVAQKASQMPTDLQTLGKSASYAVVRLGYDAISAQRESADIPRSSLPDTEFWADLLPSEINGLDKRVGRLSLEEAIDGSTTQRIKGIKDGFSQIPIRAFPRAILVALVLASPLLLLLTGFVGYRLALTPSVASVQIKRMLPKPRIVIGNPNLRLAFVPGGTFSMGAGPNDEKAEDNEKPQHKVALAAFYIGMTEVTISQFFDITGGMSEKSIYSRPSDANHDRPVEDVTWAEAIKFCNMLSQHLKCDEYYAVPDSPCGGWTASDIKIAGHKKKRNCGFRLPTEAEWEYACRAGTNTSFSCGDDSEDLSRYAWYGRRGESSPVGRLIPNSLGLFDMHGNVREMCWDTYSADYYALCLSGRDTNNPLGPTGMQAGALHVYRGGGYINSPTGLRSSDRGESDLEENSIKVQGAFRAMGFRVARDFGEDDLEEWTEP